MREITVRRYFTYVLQRSIHNEDSLPDEDRREPKKHRGPTFRQTKTMFIMTNGDF